MNDPGVTPPQKPPKTPLAWRLAGILALIGAAAVLYVLFQSVSKPTEAGFARFSRGGLAKLVALPEPPPQPGTAFTDAGGSARTLKDFRGQVVVLNLWATWCAPCVEEMPTLAALAGRFAGEPVRVVALSVDRAGDNAFAQRRLAKLSGGRLAFFHDPTYAVAFDAQTQGFPTTIVYSKDGRELARLAGAADWSGPEAAALIEAALEE